MSVKIESLLSLARDWRREIYLARRNEGVENPKEVAKYAYEQMCANFEAAELLLAKEFEEAKQEYESPGEEIIADTKSRKLKRVFDKELWRYKKMRLVGDEWIEDQS